MKAGLSLFCALSKREFGYGQDEEKIPWTENSVLQQSEISAKDCGGDGKALWLCFPHHPLQASVASFKPVAVDEVCTFSCYVFPHPHPG